MIKLEVCILLNFKDSVHIFMSFIKLKTKSMYLHIQLQYRNLICLINKRQIVISLIQFVVWYNIFLVNNNAFNKNVNNTFIQTYK